MVTPNSRAIRAMVTGLWVMAMNRVSVRRRISSSMLQKRSTLASSSGASTSSSTQIGAGCDRNTAKISAMAVSACSPPDIRLMVAIRFLGAQVDRPDAVALALQIVEMRLDALGVGRDGDRVVGQLLGQRLRLHPR